MNTECSEFQQRIPRSLVGDLSVEEQKSLDSHLLVCAACRAEYDQYAETVRRLQTRDDEPVSRHFFVYPQERAGNPWRLFRQLSPVWQGALACLAGCLLLIGAAGVSGLELRSDQGSWALSLGRAGTVPRADISGLKAEILKAVEARDQELAAGFLEELKSAIARSRSELTQQQQIQMAAAFDALQDRLTQRLSSSADGLREETGKSIAGLVQAVSQQRERDLNAIGARFEFETESRLAKARETDAILDTLLQIANLNLKQAGEQK